MSGECDHDEAVAGRDEARSWVIRLASGRLTAKDGAAFRRWHAASTAHAHAFAEAKQHWQTVGKAAAALAAETARQTERLPRKPAMPSRRWVLGMAAAAACAGVAAVRPPFDLWSPALDLSSDFHTGIGETRTIAVSDSVSVQLSTRSRLALQSDSSDDLRIALLGGEATIASKLRSITVSAGQGEAHAATGRFNLRNDDGVVRVTCLEGLTDVSCAGRQTTLQPRQQIRYDARGASSPTTIDADDLTAWQRGMLVFRDQSLRDMIAEINRYRSGKIVLLNQSLGSKPVVVASFHLDRLDEVVAQIEALYGARARHLPGGIVLLS
jgi:transmembrane sensor